MRVVASLPRTQAPLFRCLRIVPLLAVPGRDLPAGWSEPGTGWIARHVDKTALKESQEQLHQSQKLESVGQLADTHYHHRSHCRWRAECPAFATAPRSWSTDRESLTSAEAGAISPIGTSLEAPFGPSSKMPRPLLIAQYSLSARGTPYTLPSRSGTMSLWPVDT